MAHGLPKAPVVAASGGLSSVLLIIQSDCAGLNLNENGACGATERLVFVL